MDNRSIVMLNRGQLQPHPDNPRKDLGDLTELRESIRENGIMQNLTVVPCGDGLVDSGDYMILIGHRRFAASDGILDELPCVIADNLSRKEQVGIMLEENMQRSDLTYMEQARGFQMMLDLGDTVESISKKTGFSTKTIKHRLEIAKLDNESIQEAETMFQISISDFIELEKVKDIDKRNEILESVDSSVELYAAVKDYIEDVQEILISTSWGVVEDVAANDIDGEGFIVYGLDGNGDWDGVDAWMPKPEPYKKEGESDADS